MIIAIWVVALVAYLAFRLWYDGLRKPLTAKDVEEYTRLLERREDFDVLDLAVMRKFLEEDDGKEFIMMNLLQFNSSPIKHPDTRQDARADSVMQEYFAPFMGRDWFGTAPDVTALNCRWRVRNSRRFTSTRLLH